ncbi:MAG: tRNA (adenosine(37)-N6)-threonylcarbamoyltransferase complex ATPase subunit type 1 TsaE [Trueperaceae bacterium]|nr:tRNA (adenosine(37)-N6)-threonylcarbamoyltransferase complex ATPase subunit type 1 TsaE [Trueperaceae bacterium]
MHFQLDSLAATKALAQYLIEQTRVGDLIILSGPLGAGKTTLTQAIAELLGSSASVTSPTYTLIHEYPSQGGLIVHIDAYRLGIAEKLFDLGLEDYLDRARLVLVEWGEALEPLFPEAIVVRLKLEEDRREAEVIQT